MRNGRISFAVIGVLLAVFAGCASTPQASLTSEAEAKRFDPAMNSAIIYIYRPIGAGQGVSTIWVDGRLVGESLPESFFRVVARPGNNRLTTSGNDMGRLVLQSKPEGVYFVEARVEGETQSEARTLFRQVAPEVGKAALAKCCRMLETWRPGQDRLNF